MRYIVSPPHLSNAEPLKGIRSVLYNSLHVLTLAILLPPPVKRIIHRNSKGRTSRSALNPLVQPKCYNEASTTRQIKTRCPADPPRTKSPTTLVVLLEIQHHETERQSKVEHQEADRKSAGRLTHGTHTTNHGYTNHTKRTALDASSSGSGEDLITHLSVLNQTKNTRGTYKLLPL